MESKESSKKITNSIFEIARSIRGNFYNNKFTYLKQPENINSFLSLIFNDNPKKVNFVLDNILFKDIHILINTLVEKKIQSEITFILNDIFIPDKKNTERDKWLDEYTVFFPYGKEYTHNDVVNELLNNYNNTNKTTTEQISGLKIKIQAYAHYTLLYNFINQIETINYENTEQEIDKEIDIILDKLYKEVENYNKKYQKLSSDYSSSNIITSSDIESLKNPLKELVFYIKRYVYNYKEKSENANNIKKAVLLVAVIVLCVLAVKASIALLAFGIGYAVFQMITSIALNIISTKISIDDLRQEKQLINQTEKEIYKLIHDRYFLILAQNLGNKMTILLEYDKGIRGLYAYIEDTSRLFVFNAFHNQDNNLLIPLHFSMHIDNYLYGQKDDLYLLKRMLSKKIDNLEEKNKTTLQPIHSSYMEIYETSQKELYDLMFEHFTNLVYIETPHYTTHYINKLLKEKKRYRKYKKTHTYMNMVIFTNSLDMQKAGLVRKYIRKTLDVKTPHLAFNISTYHKNRNYAALDYQEYDLLVNKEQTSYKSQVMFFSCFKYVKADKFFNNINDELNKIYYKVKNNLILFYNTLKMFDEQFESRHIIYDKKNQYDKNGINIYYKEIGHIYNKINYLSQHLENIKMDIVNKNIPLLTQWHSQCINDLQFIHNKFKYFTNIYNKANITKEELISVIENSIKIQFQDTKLVYAYITNKDFIQLLNIEKNNPMALYENNCINSLHHYFKYSILLYYGFYTDTALPICSIKENILFNNIISSLNNELELIFGKNTVHQLVTNVFNDLLLSTVLIDDSSVEKYQIKNVDEILKSLQQIVVVGVGERYFYEKSVFEKSIFSNTGLSFNEFIQKDYNTIQESLLEAPYNIMKEHAQKLFIANEFYYIISLIINFIEQENSFFYEDKEANMKIYYKEFYEYKNKLYKYLSDRQDEKLLKTQPSFFKVWFNFLYNNYGEAIYTDYTKYAVSKLFFREQSAEVTALKINNYPDRYNILEEENIISHSDKIKGINNVITNSTMPETYLPINLTSADKKALFVGSLSFDVPKTLNSNIASIDIKSFRTGLIVTYITKLIDMLYERADKDSIEYSNKLLSYFYVDNTVLPPHALINNNMVCTPVEINNNFSIFDMVHLIFGDKNMDINFLLDSYSLCANIKKPDLCFDLFKQRIKTVLTGYGIKGLHNQLLEEYYENKQSNKAWGAFYAWNYIAKKHKEQKEDEPLGIDVETIKNMLGLKDEKISNTTDNNNIKINGNARMDNKSIDTPATTVAKSFYQAVCYAEGYKPDFDLVPKKIKYVENSAKKYEKRNSLFVESLHEIARQNLRSAYMQTDKKEFKDELYHKISVNQQPFIGIITLWILPQNIIEV